MLNAEIDSCLALPEFFDLEDEIYLVLKDNSDSIKNVKLNY